MAGDGGCGSSGLGEEAGNVRWEAVSGGSFLFRGRERRLGVDELKGRGAPHLERDGF
jgi:hypothetical protein